MVIDARTKFLLRMSKNIATMPEEERKAALEAVHPEIRNLVTTTVKAMLSRAS